MNYRRVYVIGVFDIFHRGHVELLRRAASLGETLVVAVNSDRVVSEYKRPPLIAEEDRLAVVQSCRYVDDAFIIDTFDNRSVIENRGIDAIVHGDDWERASYMRQVRVDEEFLRLHGTDLIFVPYTRGVSTSDIFERARQHGL